MYVIICDYPGCSAKARRIYSQEQREGWTFRITPLNTIADFCPDHHPPEGMDLAEFIEMAKKVLAESQEH